MIPLRTLFPTLAFFSSGEWFQFSMQPFYSPTHLVLVLNHRRVDRTWGAVRDHPVDVAVRGDSLEKLHGKRYFLESDREAISELFAGPFDQLPMDMAWLLAKTDSAILLQRCHQ